MTDPTPDTEQLVNAADLQPGQVIQAFGMGRTIAAVHIDGEAVTIEWTPPQDPDTWEYLTDGDGKRLEQAPTTTTIHDHFPVIV